MAPLPLQDQLRQRRPRGRPPGVQVDGPKISALIDSRGYVAERVAEAVGCSASAVSKIRSGRYRPSLALRDKLAAVLEVDADEITLAGEAGQEAA